MTSKPTVDLLPDVSADWRDEQTLANPGYKRGHIGRAKGHATLAKRGAHVGATATIFEHVRERGPMGKREVAQLTGLPLSVVAHTLTREAGHTGRMVSFGKRGQKKYALTDSPEGRAEIERRKAIRPGEFAVAAKPAEVREFRELRRDPFAFMRLALLGPR